MAQVTKKLYASSYEDIARKYLRIPPKSSSTEVAQSTSSQIVFNNAECLKNCVSAKLHYTVNQYVFFDTYKVSKNYSQKMVKIYGRYHYESLDSKNDAASSDVILDESEIEYLRRGNTKVSMLVETDISARALEYNDSEAGIYKVAYNWAEPIIEQTYIEYITTEPTITDFTVYSSVIDNPIVLSWVQEDATGWTLNVKKNNVVKYTTTGTNAGVTIPAHSLTEEGEYKFELTLTDGTTSVTEIDTLNLTCIHPTVSDFAISGNSIDYNVIASWSQNDVISWSCVAQLNGVTKLTKTGASQGFTITPGQLSEYGEYTFILTANSHHASVTSTVTVTLEANIPKIVGLEPSGVNVDKDLPFNVTWQSNFQSSYSLKVDGHTYTGTTEKSIPIAQGTITQLKQVTAILTIRYTAPGGQVRTDTKTVTFNAVGVPATPVLDGVETYSESRPTFTFTCVDSFEQFNIKIYENSKLVEDSGNVTSSHGSYTTTELLENDKTYTLQIAVKSSAGYWSDYASKNFTVNLIVSNKPTLSLSVSNDGITISSETEVDANFDYCDIFRKEENGEWIRIGRKFSNRITLLDKLLGKGKYYYKVASVSTSGGYNYSEEVCEEYQVKNFVICNVESNDFIEFIGNPNVNIKTCRDTSTQTYSGVKAPIVDIGESFYHSLSLSFASKMNDRKHFEKLVQKAKVLLYKDGRGNKFYCQVVGDIDTSKIGCDYDSISFNMVEVPFLEKDMYRVDDTPLTFFDGTYCFNGQLFFNGRISFDGTHTFSGEV